MKVGHSNVSVAWMSYLASSDSGLFVFTPRRSLPNKIEVPATRGEQAIPLGPRDRLERHLVSPVMNFRVAINIGQDPAPGMTTAGQIVPPALLRLRIVTKLKRAEVQKVLMHINEHENLRTDRRRKVASLSKYFVQSHVLRS